MLFKCSFEQEGSMKKISISILLTLILFLPVGPAFAFTKTSADQTPYLTSNAGNQVDEAILPLQDEQLQPCITVTGSGGISVLDYIGNGQIYWAVQPAFPHFYTFTGTLICTNRRTGHSTYKSIGSRGSGRTGGNVQFNVADGNSYKVTLTGTANGLGAFFYTVPSGVSVSFSIRF